MGRFLGVGGLGWIAKFFLLKWVGLGMVKQIHKFT